MPGARMTEQKRIYLASPYSSPLKSVRNDRFRIACKAAAEIIAAGHICFSPISHSHKIADYLENHNDSDYWVSQDESFLEHWAQEMWILMIPGWKTSKGIKREILFCKKKKIPVKYIKIPGNYLKPGKILTF